MPPAPGRLRGTMVGSPGMCLPKNCPTRRISLSMPPPGGWPANNVTLLPRWKSCAPDAVAKDGRARTIVARLKTNDEDARTVGSHERLTISILSRRWRLIANTDERRNIDERTKHRGNIEATNDSLSTSDRHL